MMVFEYPDANPRNERQDFIKRVIALAGDMLEVDGGHPIINGWRVPSCRVGNYEFSEGNGNYEKRGELFIEYPRRVLVPDAVRGRRLRPANRARIKSRRARPG